VGETSGKLPDITVRRDPVTREGEEGRPHRGDARKAATSAPRSLSRRHRHYPGPTRASPDTSAILAPVCAAPVMATPSVVQAPLCFVSPQGDSMSRSRWPLHYRFRFKGRLAADKAHEGTQGEPRRTCPSILPLPSWFRSALTLPGG
jgi:hypothetical protein